MAHNYAGLYTEENKKQYFEWLEKMWEAGEWYRRQDEVSLNKTNRKFFNFSVTNQTLLNNFNKQEQTVQLLTRKGGHND